jgi:acyl-CoA thioesterase
MVHGGAMFTAMDVVAGNAVMSLGNSCVTLDANVNYLRMGKPGKLTAVGKVIKKGRQIAVSDVDLFDEKGNVLCHGTFTMFVTKQKKLPNQN